MQLAIRSLPYPGLHCALLLPNWPRRRFAQKLSAFRSSTIGASLFHHIPANSKVGAPLAGIDGTKPLVHCIL